MGKIIQEIMLGLKTQQIQLQIMQEAGTTAISYMVMETNHGSYVVAIPTLEAMVVSSM
jgi:hypothetical protein